MVAERSPYSGLLADVVSQELRQVPPDLEAEAIGDFQLPAAPLQSTKKIFATPRSPDPTLRPLPASP